MSNHVMYSKIESNSNYFKTISTLGTLPSFLLQMEKLKILSLQGIPFSASNIPTTIGSLVSMELLLLGGCNIVGSLPSQIGLMKNISVLHLNSNQITGT